MRAITTLLVTSHLASVALAQDPAPAETPPVEAPEDEAPPAQHCTGEASSRWVLHQHLFFQLGPTGLESSLRFGLCFPLVDDPGLLFNSTHVEVGVANLLSPAYVSLGPYVEVIPIAPIVLRLELMPTVYFPFPFDRAGYFGLTSYNDDFRPDALTSDLADSAFGWNFNGIAMLRLRFPSEGTFRVLLLDIFNVEFWSIGDAPFFYLLRRELVLAESDWELTNDAALALEIALDDEMLIRFGVYDSIKWVFASDYVVHHVGAIATMAFQNVSEGVFEVQPLIRFGFYTHHAFREGDPYLLVGATADYDFGGL
jgi:hypothetical protein